MKRFFVAIFFIGIFSLNSFAIAGFKLGFGLQGGLDNMSFDTLNKFVLKDFDNKIKDGYFIGGFLSLDLPLNIGIILDAGVWGQQVEQEKELLIPPTLREKYKEIYRIALTPIALSFKLVFFKFPTLRIYGLAGPNLVYGVLNHEYSIEKDGKRIPVDVIATGSGTGFHIGAGVRFLLLGKVGIKLETRYNFGTIEELQVEKSTNPLIKEGDIIKYKDDKGKEHNLSLELNGLAIRLSLCLFF
jgi:hypothetical protein